MRKITRRRQHGELEIRLDRAETAKLFDRCGSAFFAPDEERRLTQTAKGLTHIDVEIS